MGGEKEELILMFVAGSTAAASYDRSTNSNQFHHVVSLPKSI